MQRFRPAPRSITLPNKALKEMDERRFMPPTARGLALHVAGNLGMDGEAKLALSRLLAISEKCKVGVIGRFMPDRGVSERLTARGIAENVDEADFFKFRKLAIPYAGISPRQRRDWESAGYVLEDFTSPYVRRAQVALGLLRMEGAQGLVIGRHDDVESQALAGSGSGIRIIEDTTDTARLQYAPAFGVVCQTTLSPKKVAWLLQQLRFRYRDSQVGFLETVSPAMTARDAALEKLLQTCDRAVIVGQAGEASCEALVETALRKGKPAIIAQGPEELQSRDFSGNPRVALTAGAFALEETIRSVAQALIEM